MDRHRLGGRAEAFLLLPFQARSLFIDLITNGVERGDWGLKGGAGESLYSCKPAPAPHNCDVCGDVLDCGCAPGELILLLTYLLVPMNNLGCTSHFGVCVRGQHLISKFIKLARDKCDKFVNNGPQSMGPHGTQLDHLACRMSQSHGR